MNEDTQSSEKPKNINSRYERFNCMLQNRPGTLNAGRVKNVASISDRLDGIEDGQKYIVVVRGFRAAYSGFYMANWSKVEVFSYAKHPVGEN